MSDIEPAVIVVSAVAGIALLLDVATSHGTLSDFFNWLTWVVWGQ